MILQLRDLHGKTYEAMYFKMPEKGKSGIQIQTFLSLSFFPIIKSLVLIFSITLAKSRSRDSSVG